MTTPAPTTLTFPAQPEQPATAETETLIARRTAADAYALLRSALGSYRAPAGTQAAPATEPDLPTWASLLNALDAVNGALQAPGMMAQLATAGGTVTLGDGEVAAARLAWAQFRPQLVREPVRAREVVWLDEALAEEVAA